MVSIVIPAYNAEKTIRSLLDSLMVLDYPEYEIIVVNDGSVDATKEIVERYSVRLIDQEHSGASAARDAGLRAARGEIVAYVDSDVKVDCDWLRNLILPFKESGVAATTGQTIFLRNDKCTSWVRSLDIERRNARRGEYTRLANGPNSAFRRDVLLEVGGFDPRWYHAEDTEVSYRIWQKGYRIRYVLEAIVHHAPEDDWRDFIRKRYRDARAFVRILSKYPTPALLKDDFVTLGMKIQPPVFLAMLVLAALAAALFTTPLRPYVLIGLVGLVLLAIALNLPEAFAVARSSRRITFFIKGLGLSLTRGLVWGAGLGIGGFKQITRI